MLGHVTPSFAIRRKLGIDATKKLPGEGFKRPWPLLISVGDGAPSVVVVRAQEAA